MGGESVKQVDTIDRQSRFSTERKILTRLHSGTMGAGPCCVLHDTLQIFSPASQKKRNDFQKRSLKRVK